MSPRLKIKVNPIEIVPGCVVLNLSGAAGGVTYRSQVVTDRIQARSVRRVETTQIKTIDNEGIVREINAVVKNVDDTVMRQLCVKMTFGHFLPTTNHVEFHKQIAELRGRVTALNAAAAAMGSYHRGRVGVLTPPLDATDPNFVTECCLTVTRALSDVLQALRNGDAGDGTGPQALRPAVLRAKNIDRLAVGESSVILSRAFDRAREVRPEIRQAIADGATPATAGVGANLRDIEAAIRFFQVR